MLLTTKRAPQVSGFPAVVGPKPTLLILGSMPGTRSLSSQQYYGHPQNSFWRIMGLLCGAAPELPYDQRLAVLKGRGIALWDVLAQCERVGSGDSAIRGESEVANAIGTLLAKQATIGALALNGGKARQAFGRHVWPILDPATRARLEIIALPSTSPACARLDFAGKWACWQALARFLRPLPD